LIPLAVVGFIFAVHSAVSGKNTAPPPPPFQEPPRSPFDSCVAGAGIVEASTQNVSVGAPVSAIVSSVCVRVGDEVEAGASLFRLDDRCERAAVAARRDALALAERQLDRLRAAPRAESVACVRARLREAESQLEEDRTHLAHWESVTDRRAVSEDEVTRKRFAVQLALRRTESAKAELVEIEAGTWAPDIQVAEANVAVARSELARAETDLERLVVTAPLAGRVLQVNVRPGELAQSSSGPPVLLGDTATLHVRIDIDEADAARFEPGARARASLKGRPSATFSLRFVRTEPFVVPKKSLTGLADERVDTRVLQVVYAVEPGSRTPLYVGQQIDAFIEARR
jgi:multidrug resistance efflux pump